MISTAALTCAVENEEIAAYVADLRSATLVLFRDRLTVAKEEGQLADKADVDGLARFLGAIIQGMSVRARDGADEDALSRLGQLALDALEQFRVLAPENKS